MFYSTTILSSRSELGVVWIAGVHGGKLKASTVKVDLSSIVYVTRRDGQASGATWTSGMVARGHVGHDMTRSCPSQPLAHMVMVVK